MVAKVSPRRSAKCGSGGGLSRGADRVKNYAKGTADVRSDGIKKPHFMSCVGAFRERGASRRGAFVCCLVSDLWRSAIVFVERFHSLYPACKVDVAQPFGPLSQNY